jgi:DNA polymerase III subunit delta
MATAARASGPWGGPALRKLVADLAKGWPPGLTVLTGDDLYHLDRARTLILDHLVPNKDDAFGLSIVGDDAVTTDALVGAARSLGMFAPRRVVYLRDVAGLSGEPEPLAAYAKNPPSKSWIIVRAPKLDRKRKLHKALAEAGICLTFRRAAGESEFRELERVLGAMAASRGVALDDGAAALLVDVCGSDLERLDAELEKMAVWLGEEASRKGETIGIATVRALVGGSGLLSGWELADALTSRDAEEAIAAARRLLDAGEEPIRTLGGIASRARSLLKAKAMEQSGIPPRDIVDAARAWYFRDALARGLKRYTLRELLAMPSRLYEADRTFKSRALDKGAVLETLVIGLTVPSAERR